MSRLATILLGPVWVSRQRRKKLVAARFELNPASQQANYARLTEQIRVEDEFVESFTTFMKDRQSTRLKQSMSVSFRGLFQLISLAVFIFVVIGLKRYFYG